MADASWVLPLAVVGGGVTIAAGTLWLTRRRTAPSDERAALAQKKSALIDELRALAPDDTRRAELERKAADVLRALDTLPPPPAATPEAPRAARPGVFGPRLVGALQGGLVVAAVFGLYLALRDNTTPRAEGQAMTGGTGSAMSRPANAAATTDGGDETEGGMDERTAPSLAPEPSPRLDAARAAAEADPDSHDARVALGWALVDARGWIELYRLVEAMVAADAEDLDALALAAPVQIAMGQREPAVESLERVLAARPDHTEALVWRGRVAELDGDVAARDGYWERARTSAHGADVERMLQAIHAAPPPRGHGAGRPPAAGDGAARERPASGDTLSGTLTLADGASAPAGAVLFLVVRAAGVTTGPPLATRKIVAPSFPRAFTIGPEDVMMQGTQLAGEVTVEARLDLDGDARTRSPGDLRAITPSEVTVGARGITLELAP